MKSDSQTLFAEKVLRRLNGPKVNKRHRKQVLILEAFAKCLILKGLADTSYAAVGSIVGMEPPHIGYYFPTWDAMLQACFRYVIATAQEVTLEGMEKAETPQQCLKAVCDAPYIHLKRFPEHAAVLTTFQLECSRNPAFRATHRAIRKQGRIRIQQIIAQMLPSIKATELEALSVAVQCIIVGYASEWVSGRSAVSSANAQLRTWQTVQTLIGKR